MSKKKPIQFYKLTPNTWDEAKQIGTRLTSCFFRGHTDNSWCLKTTLERVANNFSCPPILIGEREKVILQTFKSRAHQYIQSPPASDDFIEWLSLIQDFGGPTRLLDFTQSFYIASFFAMEKADKDACIWAIDLVPLMIQGTIKLDVDAFDQQFWNLINSSARTAFNDSNNTESFVFPIMPTRLNERLSVQKGVFLFPCNLLESFEGNLCKTFGFPFDDLNPRHAIQLDTPVNLQFLQEAYVIKITLPRKIHCDAILDLESMNIDAASLFPGLGGFARSLSNSMRHVERFGIPPKEK